MPDLLVALGYTVSIHFEVDDARPGSDIESHYEQKV